MISSTKHRCLVQDVQFHTLDRGRETVDGRTVPLRVNLKSHTQHYRKEQGINFLSNWIALKPREGSPLDELRHPARRSRAPATRELSRVPANELARCELASSLARRLRASQIARSRARRLRARLLTAGGGNAGFF
ncbi:UNVERIFIED_CONTAM: hypothetical protein Sradi_3023500 [Sesamum radiatum]|uniref:Uncharacterized protein n=1 Tax=Sesamum radiatum TaxID=300843 RepID=A0AAW2S1P9_SESRA